MQNATHSFGKCNKSSWNSGANEFLHAIIVEYLKDVGLGR